MSAPSLAELETAFVRHLRGGDGAVALAQVLGHGLAPADRLGIYRNNLALNAVDALRTCFPAVERLVGAEFFEGAAVRFAAARVSASGNLQEYGAGFPEFLAAMPEAASVPYLADVARLEWARQEALLAADAEPAGAGTAREADATLALHPSVRLLNSAWPLYSVWRYSLGDGTGDPPALDAGGERVLVARPGESVEVAPLEAGEYVFLCACRDGATLGEALVVAGAVEPGFDPGGVERHFRAGIVATRTDGGAES